ncbi:MAG: nuclear transport factor 2 family protein [Solirubrobacterales bacterium]
MSHENVEILRAIYPALNGGDAERALACLHAQAELHTDPADPTSDSYYGLAEFQRGIALWQQEWRSMRYEVEDVTQGSDRVLMKIRLHGIGKRSGAEIDREIFHVWTTRDGKAQRCEVYSDGNQALADPRSGSLVADNPPLALPVRAGLESSSVRAAIDRLALIAPVSGGGSSAARTRGSECLQRSGGSLPRDHG